MQYSVEEIEDNPRFRLIEKIYYGEMLNFVIDHLKRKSSLINIYWALCILFLIIALTIRVCISGYYSNIFLHGLIGVIVLPLFSIPVHELLHIIPYYLSGARNIRMGMDLSQYMFYVTAHRYVAHARQFRLVALFPFIILTMVSAILIIILPGAWKWSISLFMFVHATTCAGDFALLNFYHLNRDKKILTWDDADKKEAYFYEELSTLPS
jgi:hypothetical protein